MIGLRRVSSLALAIGLAFCLSCSPLPAQEDDAALERQVQAALDARNNAEAVPLAQRFADAMRARHGDRHPDYIRALRYLARALNVAERFAEAEPLLRELIALDEAVLGPAHAELAEDIAELAELMQDTGRYAEAEALYRRALAIDEGGSGASQMQLADHLRALGQLLRLTSRLGEAEEVQRRALGIAEASVGPESAELVRHLSSLAPVLLETNRIAEAEAVQRRAVALAEARFGPDDTETAVNIANLAQMLVARSALAEAEPLMRRALAIHEAKFGPGSTRVAADLGNLAALMHRTGRLAEAEPLTRRALAIDEAANGPEHPRVALHLNNLAQIMVAGDRFAEAEPLMRRSLAINEKLLGANHPAVARNLNNLGEILRALKRSDEAEPLLRRAVGIVEANFGPSHPDVASYLNNFALYLKEKGRLEEAEPMLRRVLAIYEETLGPDHPGVTTGLNNLAMLLAERGDWAGALAFIRRSATIHTADIRRNSNGSPETARRLAGAASAEYRFQVLSLYQAGLRDRASIDESFQAAQRALASETAVSMAQASARFAAGGGSLGDMVRTAQDLASRLRAAYDALPVAIANADAAAAGLARAEEARLAAEFDAVSARLAREFPDYAALASPEPLSVDTVQKLLAPNEALVQFLDLSAAGKLPETGFVWVITRKDARWAQIGQGALGLQAWTAAVRCGLDATSWTEVEEPAPETGQVSRRRFCVTVLGIESSADETPPFDLVRAHELYVTLFGGVEDVIKDRQLLIVPAGALGGLPFQTLVTKRPAKRLARAGRDFAGVSWLGQRNALAVLPSAASLRALRGAARVSAAPEPFLGFGNPLLSGPGGTDTTAWNRQDCAKRAAPQGKVAMVRRRPEFAPGALANVDALRAQWPLPETAEELCAVAATLGAKPAAVHLGAQATEAGVKQLSASGALARAKVVHFATHGLVAAETEMVTGSIVEPALMLTPPRTATALDDGLLTASEVAALKLDADWVLLSACNTASAGKSGGEDLSGLARAFFYAGARALLVSHWYVDSQATVALIGKTFAALKADAKIGRAEALRRAMSAMIKEGGGKEHPARWAPFVVVGEGGAPTGR